MSKETQLWKRLLSESITEATDLQGHFEIDKVEIEKVIARYPMRINPYYLGLISSKDDPIYRQCIPDPVEILDQKGFDDPLNEEGLSPVPGITHRYPDRVLFLVSSQCAVYCRFCNRKRKVGNASMVTDESINEGIAYIERNREITDVLLSGGDPLLLEDEDLRQILTRLRKIPHVDIIRIGTRVPCTLPHRITVRLSQMLKKFHPLYINCHFNHPREITAHASLACKRLANAGIPLGCQTVILKGVNDNIEVMRKLMKKLLTVRVRPYYLFQTDLVKGTSHFWTPLAKGKKIIANLQGHSSGLCVPHFAIDLPGGGGKVPIQPDYIIGTDGEALLIKNYKGNEYRYPPLNCWEADK